MDKSLPSCYIFDIDGTLAIMKDRGPYERDKVGQDEVNKVVKETLDLYSDHVGLIMLVSGRDSVCQGATERWLAKNNIKWKGLYMRKEGDMREDVVIKKEYLDDIVKDYYVRAVFDDRDQCVKMWRSLGLTCFQVADGNF